MSNRLDQEREKELQPIRIQTAIDKIKECGCEILHTDETTVIFLFNGQRCTIWPYSGWHSGKTIKPGRGLSKLLRQLK